MLNKTPQGQMILYDQQEERRLNALYLAVINMPQAPAEEQMEEADKYYKYLQDGSDNAEMEY